MGRTYKTEGVILKRNNFGEADRILTIFTKHYGKIKVIAKGVRRIRSRKGGNVESFNRATLFLAKGKNIDLLTEAVVIDAFRFWRKDLLKVGLAFYFCELVDKLTAEGQENQKVYSLLVKVLSTIGKLKPAELVRGFEEDLLDELGFGVPTQVRQQPKSLVNYIETVTEREIKAPKVIKKLT